MDLTDLRAVYGRVRAVAFENDGPGRKEAWREALRERVSRAAAADAAGALPPRSRRHACYEEAEGPFDPDAAPRAVRTTYDAAADLDESAAMAREDRDAGDKSGGRRGSVVASALSSLRRTSSFGVTPARAQPPRRASSAVGARLARRPTLGGNDLMNDLKSSLRRRSALSGEEPVEPRTAPPVAVRPRRSLSAPPDQGDFLAQLRAAAAARREE